MKIFWFTGLSGAGKTTIARRAKEVLEQEGKKILLIDGDEIRSQYPRALGFSREDILQNNRFIAGMCRQRAPEFDYIFVSVITPFHAIRRELKENLGGQYVEVYVKVALDEVIRRDVKGLYKKALAGEIRNFIGIDTQTPYEPPENPDVVIDTGAGSVESSVEGLMQFIRSLQRSL
jgi:adenylyl-sulfate kinase